MINSNLKLYIKYVFLIIFLTSCENKTISEFDENIEELITWAFEEEIEYQSVNYTPITSKTLADLLTLKEYKNLSETEKGIIIGYFNFENDKIKLTESNKDLLILISKAQKYENFDILIESNDIKSNLNGIVDEIERILLSNGVKENNIKVNSLENINQNYIIKIIKLL